MKNFAIDRCCNPFEIHKHHTYCKGLRTISDNLLKKFVFLCHTAKVCTSCRKEMAKISALSPLYDVNEANYVNIEQIILEENHNQFVLHNDDDIDKDIFDGPPSPKLKKLEMSCSNEEHQAAVEVFNQIKEKFKNSTNNSERLRILTLAPQSWGRRKIAAEFGASERQARKSKELVKKFGILTSPDVKKGKTLSDDTAKLVLQFYENDNNSRIMPGRKDYVSVKNSDGSRKQVQKRLILGNLSELYQIFKSAYPEIKISYSKFCELRPKNCVLAGASGTRTVRENRKKV